MVNRINQIYKEHSESYEQKVRRTLVGNVVAFTGTSFDNQQRGDWRKVEFRVKDIKFNCNFDTNPVLKDESGVWWNIHSDRPLHIVF